MIRAAHLPARMCVCVWNQTAHVTPGPPVELPLVAVEGGKTYAFDGHSVLRHVPVHEMVTLVMELVAEIAITVPSKVCSSLSASSQVTNTRRVMDQQRLLWSA